METVRAFIAINIGEEVRLKLEAFQQPLKATGADVRWVKPGNIHLTLAFLGNVEIQKFQALETAISENFQGLETFELTIRSTGVFGRRNRPSVVWAGIEESPQLAELHEKTVALLEPIGIPFHEKRFRPHLTLGRFNSLKNSTALFQCLEENRETDFQTLEVNSVQLIQSELLPTGAKYTVLHEARF